MENSEPFGATTPYRGLEKLGEGAHGSVWEVEHRRLGKRFAVKLLHEKHAGDANLADRMRAEAQLLARLEHPNVVKVHDLSALDDGRMYFVMERLAGVTLREILRLDGPLQPAEAVEIVCQILRGLAAAHDHGLVHRDVKPANVFCCDGEPRLVKLLDFGVAKLLEDAQVAPLLIPTATGSVAGTPRYMAPEQALGRRVDARADLYSAGVVLYECLTGATPFHRHRGLDLLVAHVQEAPRAPSERAPRRLSAGLDRLVLRALEKSPDRRFRSAGEFIAALEAVELSPPPMVVATEIIDTAVITPTVGPGPVVLAPTVRLDELERRSNEGEAARDVASPPLRPHDPLRHEPVAQVGRSRGAVVAFAAVLLIMLLVLALLAVRRGF